MKIFPHHTAALGCILLSACAASPPLASTAWVLAELPGRTVPPQDAPTLRFENGRALGTDGCNRFIASYSSNGATVNIAGQAAATQMGCPGNKMRLAAAFMAALGEAKTYRADTGRLLLLDGSGATLAAFAAQQQTLAGSSWRVTGYNNGKQAVVSVLTGTELTLTFAGEGELSGTGGCNRYTGSYQAAGTQLSIGSIAATRMLCATPPGIMDQESRFFAALQTAATARFEGGRLELRTAGGQLAASLQAE